MVHLWYHLADGFIHRQSFYIKVSVIGISTAIRRDQTSVFVIRRQQAVGSLVNFTLSVQRPVLPSKIIKDGIPRTWTLGL